MNIKFNYEYTKDCLFEIDINYVLNSGFYELRYEFKNHLPSFNDGTIRTNYVISNELESKINTLEKNLDNLLMQLKIHYKIHTYFFEEDIKKQFADYRQELKFMYDLIIPMIQQIKDTEEEPSEILTTW